MNTWNTMLKSKIMPPGSVTATHTHNHLNGNRIDKQNTRHLKSVAEYANRFFSHTQTHKHTTQMPCIFFAAIFHAHSFPHLRVCKSTEPLRAGNDDVRSHLEKIENKNKKLTNRKDIFARWSCCAEGRLLLREKCVNHVPHSIYLHFVDVLNALQCALHCTTRFKFVLGDFVRSVCRLLLVL